MPPRRNELESGDTVLVRECGGTCSFVATVVGFRLNTDDARVFTVEYGSDDREDGVTMDRHSPAAPHTVSRARATRQREFRRPTRDKEHVTSPKS